MLGTVKKQPNEVIDVDVSFDTFLPTLDEIVSIESFPDDPSLVIPFTDIVDNNRTVKVWLQEGTDGIDYKVTVRIHTSGGRVVEAEFKVKLKET
jgi:hypothetical protein